MKKTVVLKTLQISLVIVAVTFIFCWSSSPNDILENYSPSNAKIVPPQDSMLATVTNFTFKSNEKLTVTDFEQLFPENWSYLIDLENKESDFEKVQFLRLRHLKLFCEKELLNFTAEDIKSITLFTPYHYYECRVPKTGKACRAQILFPEFLQD